MNQGSKSYAIILFLILTQLIVSLSVTGQNNDNIITGVVTSFETGDPIEIAEVFISGTTKGTITDKNGYFNLKVPFFPCTMVVDHISFDSNITLLDGKNNKHKIVLKPFVKSVDEIMVTGKNNRKKNLRFFYSRFIKEKSNKIKVLNDSVLYFRRDKEEFIAYSHEPLIVINEILGYKIKLILKRLRIKRIEYPNGPSLALNSFKGMEFAQITGYYFYEPLNTPYLKQQESYEKNRQMVYFGSDKHFLQAIFNTDFKSQGFELKIYPKDMGRKGFVEVKNKLDKTNGKSFIMDCDSILSSYWHYKDRIPVNIETDLRWKMANREITKIYRSNKIFKIRENGTSPDVDFFIIGPMSNSDNLANSLPQDYNPLK